MESPSGSVEPLAEPTRSFAVYAGSGVMEIVGAEGGVLIVRLMLSVAERLSVSVAES